MVLPRRTFLAVCASAALLTACGRRKKLPPIQAGQVVLAFGDSVTYGTGAKHGEEDWPTLIASATGWQVINAGIPGDTAEAGRNRIGPLLDEHKPALVIIEIGGNDFLRRRAATAVKEDLRALIKAARQAGAQVALVGVPELSIISLVAGKASDAAIYAELAKEENILLIADVFSDVLSKPELCADKIHPNAAGYKAMAAGMVQQLRESGLSSAR